MLGFFHKWLERQTDLPSAVAAIRDVVLTMLPYTRGRDALKGELVDVANEPRVLVVRVARVRKSCKPHAVHDKRSDKEQENTNRTELLCSEA